MSTIRKTYNLPAYKGDVGIEIEVEGRNLINQAKGWRVERDGSLRGEEAFEYVTDKGVRRENIDDILGSLEKSMEDYGSEIMENTRAGVHVHVNIQELTHTELANFATLYYVLENIMVRYCGKYREGNLFCLRADDAGAIIPFVAEAISTKDLKALHTDEIRYASLNWKPASEYGSIEFRAMRTTENFEHISNWAKMLLEIRDSALTYTTPTDILSEYSMNTPEDFLKRSLGSFAEMVMFEGFEEPLQNGMYNAQDFAYGVDWAEIEESIARCAEKRKEMLGIQQHRASQLSNLRQSIHERRAAEDPEYARFRRDITAYGLMENVQQNVFPRPTAQTVIEDEIQPYFADQDDSLHIEDL